MKYLSPSEYYQLELSDSWEVEQEDNTISIYNKATGWGAINITSYQIPSQYSFDTKKELVEFIDRNDISYDNIKEATFSNSTISSMVVIEKESYWEYYVIYGNHKALFITYNCASIDKTREIYDVHQIINSIYIL